MTDTRGRHVHERRYDDQELGRLSLSELLASKDDARFQTIYEWTYREIRKTKLAWIKHNNESIKTLLDACFGVLHSLLFNKQGKMKFPPHLERLTKPPIGWIPACAGMTKTRRARVRGHPGLPPLPGVPGFVSGS